MCGVLLLFAFIATAMAQSTPSKLGIEIDGLGDASRARPFVNHARLFRPCTAINGTARVPVDTSGWPTADAQCVMFDVRAIPAWAPPIDDPAQFQPDWSGTWALSFDGSASVGVPSGGASITDLQYDPEANRTTAALVVNRGTGLIILAFRDTIGGFRNLRLIRPGYAADTGQTYTDEFLRSLRPFQVLRYMDFTATNSVTPSANADRHLEWSERHLPSDATQQTYDGKTGAAWEFAVQLANQTGTDMWINIPVSASEDYIRELAALITGRLNRGLRIYIEHGNEVWNPLFANSYNFNRNAALAEVRGGVSNLNNDNQPTTAIDVFGRRRHLRRVIEAVQVFRQAAGGDPDRIRGIFAWWTIQPEQYRTTLAWGKATFGDLSALLYGIANTHYYSVSRAMVNDSPERLLEVMRASSDSGVNFDNQYRQISREFGLHHTIYEGGPDVGGGSTNNIGNRILANRLPGMKDLLLHDMKTNWFDRGGEEYMYFAHCGPCSRFGCWGATEDIVDLNTPKLDALRELAGALPGPTVERGSFESGLFAGTVVTITGSNFSRGDFTWDEATIDGEMLPTMLGGVQVLFKGTPGQIVQASDTKIEVVVPTSLTGGEIEVDVWTKSGTWKGSAFIEGASSEPARVSIKRTDASPTVSAGPRRHR